MKKFVIRLTAFALVSAHFSSFAQGLPIKPARTIEFTTDEGSYMDVDLSPDGRTIAFDLLGDLYTVPVTGGVATQLTRGLAINKRPIWSPDGTKLAYISDTSGDYRLNIRDLKGSFHKVLGKVDLSIGYNTGFFWFPDGNYVSIINNIFGIYGGELASRPLFYPIAVSNDKRNAYYLDSGRIYKYNYNERSRSRWSDDLEPFQSFALSPDGQWWAFVKDSNSQKCLVIQSLASHKERILVPSLYETKTEYLPSSNLHFSISADSKWLYISYKGKIHKISLETGLDEVVPFTAHVKADLGALDYNTYPVNHDSIRVKYIRSANESPDGRHLVFSALDRLYVMDLPKGKPHPLVSQNINQFQPVYSPDGHWIAYVSWCDISGGEVWKVPATGGSPIQLTFIPGQYQKPDWSPDGQTIAVMRGAPKLGDRDDIGRGELILIPAGGGEPKIIKDTIPLANQLEFTPDGQTIMFAMQPNFNKAKNFKLASKDKNGNNFTPIAISDNFAQPTAVSQSPDGKFIVYSLAEGLYLLPVSQTLAPVDIYDPGENIAIIHFADGVDPRWEKEGKAISWCYGNHFYKVSPEKIIHAAQHGWTTEDPLGLRKMKIIHVSAAPDETIEIPLGVPSYYGKGTLALTNVRIITMADRKVIEHGTIVIRDGRFVSAGPSDNVTAPASAKSIDLSGKTIIPGLIDLHLHVRTPPNIFPQQSWMYLADLAYGITTGRDPSSSLDSYGYCELLNSGQMIGPRLFSVGRAARFNDGTITLDNLQQAKDIIKKRALYGSNYIKQYTLPIRLQRQWLLMAAKEAGLNLTNEGEITPLDQVAMTKDGVTGIEHNALWGDAYKDVYTFLRESRVFLDPTLQVSPVGEPGEEWFKHKYWHQYDKKLAHFTYSDPVIRASLNNPESYETILAANPKDTLEPDFLPTAIMDAKIYKNGGRLLMGSHGNDEGIGAHNEIWALQMGGLSNMDVLEIATIEGAKAMGMQKDLGSIEPGKIADLIILNKNPLDDIHNTIEIKYVMKDGILYDGDTLNTLWPFAKQCPEWTLRQN